MRFRKNMINVHTVRGKVIFSSCLEDLKRVWNAAEAAKKELRTVTLSNTIDVYAPV
jgi:hypothetical protein